MRKSIFFYKELTPAEVGKTGTHEVYIRMPNNFDYETFFGNTSAMNGSVLEVNFTAHDITNGGDVLTPLRFAYFINSNQEKRIPSLGVLFKNHNIQEGDVVCLESRTDGSNATYYLCFYKKGEIQVNPAAIYFTQVERDVANDRQNDKCDLSLQQIFYGAPGTGKSHRVNDVTEAQPEENVFRTTFHPDSDYSTFVGCYKPTKVKSERLQRMNLSLEDLAKELGSYYSNSELGKIGGIQKFCFEYYPYIDGEYMSVNVTKLLELAGVPKDYNVEINKYIKFCHLLPKQDPNEITYTFVPQAFTKAYLRAWQTEDPVYLVIEEINRGNCAQIFGDLFQLLDRKEGKSEYPIKPDTDLGNFIVENLTSPVEGAPEKVVKGELMILPKNLYIWATMNTSDQSLFPIDSAFKRRWDWKYIPINTRKEQWFIEAEKTKYSWSAFLETINDIINEKTSSEDKQLGFYFCKANGDTISAETFVSKVVFYLWNDVFKDYGFDGEYFADPDGGTLEFRKFFNFDGTINEKKVTAFMKNLKIGAEGEDNTDADNQGSGTMKVSFPDNTIIEGETTVDVFMKTITKVVNEHGLDAVKNAEIRFSGLNMIQEEGWTNEKYPNSSQKQMDGYVLFLHADNPTKKSALEKLSERLSLGLIVEFVS